MSVVSDENHLYYTHPEKLQFDLDNLSFPGFLVPHPGIDILFLNLLNMYNTK
jgi:hypothetical protein